MCGVNVMATVKQPASLLRIHKVVNRSPGGWSATVISVAGDWHADTSSGVLFGYCRTVARRSTDYLWSIHYVAHIAQLTGFSLWERAGVKAFSAPNSPHPNPLPEGEGVLTSE